MKTLASNRRFREQGFSILELVIVLVIIGITMFLALPGYRAWVGNVQIRSVGESIQNGMQFARGEAVRRNRAVIFDLTDIGNGTGDWLVGCAAPVDGGVADVEDEATDCLATIRTDRSATVSANVTIEAAEDDMHMVTFNAMGRVTTNGDATPALTSLTVRNTSLATDDARELVVRVGPGGGIRMCDPNLPVATDPRGCD